MNMIKSIAIALILSGSAAVLPHSAVAQTLTQGTEKITKSDFEGIQKIFNKEKADDAAFERFRVLMQKAVSFQKNALIESNEAPAQTAKYEKMTAAYDKVILARRTNNKLEVSKAMTAFISLL